MGRPARGWAQDDTARGTSARTCRPLRAVGGGYAAAGFGSRSAAVAALEALRSPMPASVQGVLVGEWLERWLASRLSLRDSTVRGYAAHVRGYLIPYLGGVALAELAPADVQAMFTAIIGDHAALGRPVTPATLRRIHRNVT
ncbi:MAG TPA: hypothetical protein VGI74_26835 [Streptosporangiaceae bacterium]